MDSDLTEAITNQIGKTDGIKLQVNTGDGAVRFAVAGDGVMTLGTNHGDVMNNLAIGDADALDSLTSGGMNYIIGHATDNHKLTTGSRNLFFGHQNGEDVTTGEQCTAVGHLALGSSAADADRVTALGYKAGLVGNDDSTYIGAYAGEAVTSLSNTAVGSNCMLVDGPESSTAVGRSAHQSCTGDNNVAVGAYALDAAGAATNCVALGMHALGLATNNGNIGIGKNAGNAITSGSSNICIGSDSDAAATAGNQIAIGLDAVTDAANKVRLGNTSVTNIDGEVAFNATSDARTKTNVQDLELGLDFINALRPVSFTRVHPAEYPAEILDKRFKQGQKVEDKDGNVSFESTESFDVETGQPIKDTFDETTRSDGLIAQEVQAVCDSLGVQFNGINETSQGKLGLQYGLLVSPLIAAVQELSSRNESLAARIATLEEAS